MRESGPDGFAPDAVVDAFTVRPAAVAVHRLGSSGAARRLLRAWPTPNWPDRTGPHRERGRPGPARGRRLGASNRPRDPRR
ncbi:hypothetical protein ACWDRR_23455 [Kitasatospora sp. NPDC003701]